MGVGGLLAFCGAYVLMFVNSVGIVVYGITFACYSCVGLCL